MSEPHPEIIELELSPAPQDDPETTIRKFRLALKEALAQAGKENLLDEKKIIICAEKPAPFLLPDWVMHISLICADAENRQNAKNAVIYLSEKLNIRVKIVRVKSWIAGEKEEKSE